MSTESLDVHFVSNEVRLAATLMRPARPKGGVLFINGSGPLDRDSNIDGQRLDIAVAFARDLADAGYASLRFDKRGVGGSTGDALTGGFNDELTDATNALDHLRAVVDDPLFVIGHSVGGTIAMRLGATNDLGGLVLLATPAQPLRAVARWQTERIATTLPGPQWLLPRMFRAAQRRSWRSIEQSTGDTVRGGFQRRPARWFREALAHDPTPDMAAIACPVLAVTGRKDLQVDAADVATIGDAIGGPFRGDTPADLTHLLRTEPGPGGVLSYRRQMKRPVDPALLDTVVSWIEEQRSYRAPDR